MKPMIITSRKEQMHGMMAFHDPLPVFSLPIPMRTLTATAIPVAAVHRTLSAHTDMTLAREKRRGESGTSVLEVMATTM